MSYIPVSVYFVCIIVGLFGGLYVGFSIRYAFIKREEEYLLRVKKKSLKNKIQAYASKHKPHIQAVHGKIKNDKKKEGKKKEDKNILSSRVEDSSSFTRLICENEGKDAKSHVQNSIKSQDAKYNVCKKN